MISGRFGGRDLGAVPKGVRPTSDRVRESLFSVLGSVSGLHVLDLFAGTGALGIEAYSRGAAGVVFVERSRKVRRELERRLQALGIDQDDAIQTIGLEARKAITLLDARQAASFDLIFLDPPYAGDERERCLDALFASALLSERARVVVEGPKRHPVTPRAGARVVDERRYGETVLTWLESA